MSNDSIDNYFSDLSSLPKIDSEELLKLARGIKVSELALWSTVFFHNDCRDIFNQIILLELDQDDLNVLASYQFPDEKASFMMSIDIDREYLLGVIKRSKNSDLQKIYVESNKLRAKFVEANLKLVVSIAKKFGYSKMPLEDLIQEGNIGLLKAIQRFDPERGFKFSTYATWWIRHAISRSIADKSREIRVPVHLIDAHYRIQKVVKKLASELGRVPTREEIAEATEISEAKLDQIISIINDHSISIDTSENDEDRSLSDVIADLEHTHALADMQEKELLDQITSIVNKLKPLESSVLKLRFGFGDKEEMTLKEIGDKYGLSRERIRQIQDQALEKVRQALQRSEKI